MTSHVSAGDMVEFPAPSDIDFFARHGWWISSKPLREELVDELAYGVQRYLAGERDTPLPFQLGLDVNPLVANTVSQGDYASLQVDELYRFVRDPTLPAIASMLCGSSSIRLFHDQIVYKPPIGPEVRSTVGWHSDKAYWRTCTSDSMLTAWVALQDTPLEMGPIAFWDCSHRWPGIEDLHTFDIEELDQIEQMFAHKNLRPEIRMQPMKKGQFSFHHCRVVHGSYPNQTSSPRLGFAIHYQDDTNHFNCVPRSDGRATSHLNDILCRKDAHGNPDYADPDICPRLWPN
jgi:hypothetical protein